MLAGSLGECQALGALLLPLSPTIVVCCTSTKLPRLMKAEASKRKRFPCLDAVVVVTFVSLVIAASFKLSGLWP